MTSESKGVYNKSPVFNGENYGYWMDCMCIHINSIDRNLWNAIQNGPFKITITNADDVVVRKPETQWNTNDEQKYSCDWKVRNILISAVRVYEYYRVSHCETTKVMWDSLQVTHEGTNEVKKARINTLNQEFELFHIKNGETIADMQKRFTHLINRLNALGKPVSNEIATNNILRCLNRKWKPKVTAIKEDKNLLTLDITTLFGKLEEHEQELICLEKHEKKIKKEKNKEVENKSTALVASSSKSSTKEHDESRTSYNEKSDNEIMRFFVKRYHKYIKRNGVKHSDNNLINFRRQDKINGQYKKSSKLRRACVAWESDSESSSEGSSSESDEAANFCLMAHHHKKKNVSHYKYEPIDDMSYSELQPVFENLYGEAVDAFKRLSPNKRIFSYLEAKVLETEKQMEALKQTMLDASKVDVEEDKSSWFDCETCHIWQKEVECLCFMERMWFLDSGFSRHMTGDISLFIDFTPKKKVFVTYGDNNKGAILGKGSVGNPSSTNIYDVILVEGLKHNLISISQLCDKGYKITFTNTCCIIEHNDK
ncbi:uncharacterized protein LOC127102179 [Lathyrus oleraceus]|uniref:uncharacterized protein LOC127102179 n=1 Tax=Pisum sativum TaxID=3888 RepID=UPI0021D0D91D|nr:uncharacterized protein LOC127102179 [Pisum sativum]